MFHVVLLEHGALQTLAQTLSLPLTRKVSLDKVSSKMFPCLKGGWYLHSCGGLWGSVEAGNVVGPLYPAHHQLKQRCQRNANSRSASHSSPKWSWPHCSLEAGRGFSIFIADRLYCFFLEGNLQHWLKFKIYRPFELATPLLGLSPTEIKAAIHKDIKSV